MSTNPKRPEGERRRVSRHPLRGGTTANWWSLPDLGPSLAAELRDISEDGIRLIVRKALEQGSNIQVSIQPPDDGAPVVCALEVIWCAASGAAYLVGGRFQNRLSDDEMSRLI
jgi:hypothetical protein